MIPEAKEVALGISASGEDEEDIAIACRLFAARVLEAEITHRISVGDADPLPALSSLLGRVRSGKAD